MADPMWTTFVKVLTGQGLAFEPGLSGAEVERVEASYGFRFPPDLRAFLEAGLPVGEGFPNWRSGPEASLRDRLQVPLQGILFDVEHNRFWLKEWGPRPERLEEALGVVRERVAKAPVLIPVFGHRMIPDRPHQAGNPVFSVHQTDIIHYGVDLRDYLLHEFLSLPGVGVWPIPEAVRPIEFWDLERFASVRWERGYAIFDNRSGVLPRGGPR